MPADIRAASSAALSTEDRIASELIVVIGASAGGVEAVSRVVRDLPEDFPAAVFVAMHFPANATSVLPRILSRAGPLEALHPIHGDAIQRGKVYVAPPDEHLLIRRNRIELVRGPRENGNRPAIDPMFRSAAVAYGSRVVGVILTGNLDDGTAGLLAIKRRGGVALAQDPADALFPSMPASAIKHVAVDHVLRLDAIPPALTRIVSAHAQSRPAASSEDTMPDHAERETQYDAADLAVIEDVEQHPGKPSPFGCPDCGGVLWRINDGELMRFRCRVGHGWTGDALMSRHVEQMDTALWTALRALEESASLTRLMCERARKHGNDALVAMFERDLRIAEERAQTIRDALLAVPPSRPGESEGPADAVAR